MARKAHYLDRWIDKGKAMPTGRPVGRPPIPTVKRPGAGWHGDSYGHSMARRRAMARDFAEFEKSPKYREDFGFSPLGKKLHSVKVGKEVWRRG